MKPTVLSALAALTSVSATHAQQRPPAVYGEVGYAVLSANVSGMKFKPHMARGILGIELHPNIALEGMFALATKDDTFSAVTNGTPVNLTAEVEDAYGFAIVPKFKVTPKLELLGRVGYTQSSARVKLTDGTNTIVGTDSDGDLSFGLGLRYFFEKNYYVAFDHMNYYNRADTKVRAATLGLGMRF